MILTTSIKHSFTTTKHNHKSYIFTLYLFMLLCVVGNCLLFYCGCTGNCENCCGINGSIKYKSESEIGKDIKNKNNNKKNNKKNNSEINNDEYKNENNKKEVEEEKKKKKKEIIKKRRKKRRKKRIKKIK